MKSYRYASFPGPSGLHTRWEVRKLIQIQWCFENISAPSWWKWGIRAHKHHFHFQTWFNAPVGQGKIGCCVETWRQWCSDADICEGQYPLQYWFSRWGLLCQGASSIVEELCYGEAIPDPTTRPILRALTHGGRWGWRQCWDPSGSLTPCSIQPKIKSPFPASPTSLRKRPPSISNTQQLCPALHGHSNTEAEHWFCLPGELLCLQSLPPVHAFKLLFKIRGARVLNLTC